MAKRTKAQRSATAKKGASARKRNLEELKKQNENTRLSNTNTGLEEQVTRLKNELVNVWKKPQNWGLAVIFGAITGLAVNLIITALSS